MTSQAAIFGPFFAMMFLTLVVWVYMYIRRIAFITASGINSQDLAVPGKLAELSPPSVSNPSDNLKNLFEMPVLFYALALYLFVTSRVDAIYVDMAWIFVAPARGAQRGPLHHQHRDGALLRLRGLDPRAMVHAAARRPELFLLAAAADFDDGAGNVRRCRR